MVNERRVFIDREEKKTSKKDEIKKKKKKIEVKVTVIYAKNDRSLEEILIHNLNILV